MKKKIKQLRYVEFAEFQLSPYFRQLNKKSKFAIQTYKQKNSLV
ncbi:MULTISPECIES: hypothetical protein [unclassified Bacillus (in: firmicutes)]